MLAACFNTFAARRVSGDHVEEAGFSGAGCSVEQDLVDDGVYVAFLHGTVELTAIFLGT